MGRFFLIFTPWWMFAIFAFFMGSLTVPFYEDYRAVQTEQQFALSEGPPTVVDIIDFRADRDAGYLDEVHISGRVLASLGILRFGGEGTDYDGVVLGGENDMPEAVLLFETLSSERDINALIASADINSRVVVQGFITSDRRSDVEREITRRGYSGRDILIVEPYLGNRAGVIGEIVQDTQIGFYIVAGMTALFALMTVWRFRRWRKRRAIKRLGESAKYGQKKPATALAEKAKQALAAQANPWGNTAQKTATNTVPKSKPIAQSKPGPKRMPEPEPDLPIEFSTFKSVFPDGGSAFRFKSADEIVRQYFGSLTTITRSNPDS